MNTPRVAKLALEDGTVFTGLAVGASGTRAGEVVFNTAMTGYQEVFTDPSYCGQIVTMTFPLLGNYGVNAEDFESTRLHLSGVVFKELPRRPSNFRATLSLPEYLEKNDVVGVVGIDTRALARRIRIEGALRGVLSTEIRDDLELVRRAQAVEPMSGANLVTRVTSSERTGVGPAVPLPRREGAGGGFSSQPDDPHPTLPLGGGGTLKCHIVALDCGIKHSILRRLSEQHCRVTTVPATASAGDIRDLKPDGLLIGNGPGDPAAVTQTIATLRELLGTMPMLGICLGHQLLALALGATTYKLRFGHHGANVPVINHPAGRVEITSQNHGFAVDLPSLERVGGTATHMNLNDGSLEGFAHQDRQVAAVQFHPEANPGPHDAAHIFAAFVRAVATRQPLGADVFGK